VARQHLDALVKMSPGHERAKALLAQLESAAPDMAAAPAAPDMATVAAVVPAPKGGGEPSGEEKLAGGGSYPAMISQANKLSENGKVDAARKLYEKALVSNPNGVEALTGLGYCDLDKEKFLAAVDHFKHALAVAPDYGDALIGLAESYKVRGDKTQAAEFYRRYLKAQPNGSRAAMAQKNLKELERPSATPTPAPPEEKKLKEDDNALPRPPVPVDEPPPP
jgi:tetratricopeptide (TPR) repeat protein